jgi:DNA-binding PadR family transcriptional regulator
MRLFKHGFSRCHDHTERRFARPERGEEGYGGRMSRHGEGRGGRGGLGRFFAHGDLRLVILHLIADKPRHGYEIIKAIEDQVGGSYSPSPGVVYPTLTLLEELGYVEVTPEAAGRKLHSITAEGRAFLEANRRTLDALLARMAEASRGQGEPKPQLVRAVENLKLALRLRVAAGPLSDDQANQIAAAIDAAARAVENTK